MISKIDSVLYFKALADETRLSIIAKLSSDNLCACDILDDFNFTQPTLSYHMKILVEAGLVQGTKDGNWVRYSLNRDIIESLGLWLVELSSRVVTSDSKKNC